MAMIEDNYYINVAKLATSYTGKEYMRHYCKVELGDCLEKDAVEKFNYIKRLFPDHDFELTLYKVNCCATKVKEEII